MNRLLFVPVFVAALAALGCSDECSSAFDCEADEVCSNGICAPAQAAYLSCTSDDECNDGDPNGPFECVASRCRLVGGTVGVTVDSGVAQDAGTSSTADAGP